MLDLVGGSLQRAEKCAEMECRQATLREGLELKKKRLEAQLGEVNEAISALEANPEVERVINLLARANR